MDKFLEQMARVMPRWPDYAQWSVSQIIDYTHFPPDDVVAWMSFGLQRQVETDTRLSYEEATAAVEKLTQAHEEGAHVSFSPSGVVSENLQQQYEALIARNRTHLQGRDWRRAYKNLSNFMATNASKLPLELYTEAASETLRLAVKSQTNVQEIYNLLDTAIDRLLTDETKAGVTEALDIVDAYAEPLVSGSSELVTALFAKISPLANKHDMTAELKQISNELLQS